MSRPAAKPAGRLDELDHRIIEQLSNDARQSNRTVAAALQVTEGTVRTRIKRMQSEGLIRITAVTDLAWMKGVRLAFIGIDVMQEHLREVADRIAEMDDIRAVIVLLGRYDLLAIALLESIEQLTAIANDRILALRGVRHVETTLATQIFKYEYRRARILSPQKAQAAARKPAPRPAKKPRR